MWLTFRKILNNWIFLLILIFFSNTSFAQYPMSDSTHFAKIDSTKLNDSIRKYTLAHIDTSFLNIAKIFNPKPFTSDLPIEKMQIQTPQLNYKFSWLMVLLLLCIIIITFVKLYYQNYYSILFNYVYSFHIYSSTRDLGALNNLGAFLLNIVFIICTSMSLYFITIYFYPFIQDKFSIFFIILLIFIIHYLLKILVLYYLEFFIKNKSNIEFYIKSISRTNQFMALCLLFVLVIYLTGAKSYDQIIIYILLIILVFGQIIKYIKGLLSNIQQITSYFFHFIIYICTLEIAPLLIIYKLFIRHI